MLKLVHIFGAVELFFVSVLLLERKSFPVANYLGTSSLISSQYGEKSIKNG